MKFTYSQYPNEPRYYIWLKHGTITSKDKIPDERIANYIGITLDQYQDELCNLGAYIDDTLGYHEIYFNKKIKAQNAIKMLNEKYGILFSLIN